MSRTQQHRKIAINTPLGEDVLLLRAIHGTERMGRSFTYSVDLLSEKFDIDFDKVLGENITARIQIDDDTTRYVNGFISAIEQTGVVGRTTSYRATVVPWLWFLTRTSDCRIFQEKTAPEIITELFRELGFTEFKDQLTGSYPTRAYCVQYRESDFDFVSRLMEEEGIYYYFKHEDGKHTLVMCDAPTAHEAAEGAASFVYGANKPEGEEDWVGRVTEWSISKSVRPGAYAHDDYNFETPKTELAGKAQTSRSHSASDFEVFDYPGLYGVTGEGERLASVRMEELQTPHEVATGEASARDVYCGAMFELTDHPREDQNRKYVLTEVSISAVSDTFDAGSSGGSSFHCSFEAIPSEAPFRPERRTPKPVVQGPQTAVVVGKSGEEIWTDEFGRVKVMFHWDRYAAADETTSCWVRVSQEFAGKRWGSMQVPRIGQEVIVSFLEGDPDRPLITGRVYNADCRPPYDPKQFGTVATWKTNSSKGGGGFNELRFEDKAGEEQVFLHAQKNMDIRVLNDRFETVVNDRHLIVENDKFEHVKNERHEQVDSHHKELVKGDRNLTVEGKQAVDVTKELSVKVGKDVAEKFDANASRTVTKDYYIKGKNVCIEAETNLTLKVGQTSIALESGGIGLKTMGDIKGEATKSITMKATMDFVADATKNVTLKGLAGATLEGTGPTEVKSAATMTVKGMVVMIN